MTQTVIITRGLPASGKSTWSKELTQKDPSFKRINRDDLRMMIYFGKWNKKREEAVLQAREALIFSFLRHKYNLVLDDTNLVPERLSETIKLLKMYTISDLCLCNRNVFRGIKVEIKDFIDVPLETCIDRNSKRPPETRVPEKFIRDYHKWYVTKLLQDRGQTEWTISY